MPNPGPPAFAIGALAHEAGVSVETIRFYQARGLLSAPRRPPGTIRRYGEADVARVRFVKAAQRLGFCLDEIGELLRLDDGTRCRQASEIAARRLADVRIRLADLQRMEAVLGSLVDACQRQRGNVSCPLIAALQDAPLPSPAPAQK